MFIIFLLIKWLLSKMVVLIANRLQSKTNRACIIILMICFFFFLFFSIKISTGLALNTSSLTARRDSFDRNTSAFSPSLDFSSSSVAVAANGNGTASRKWPVNNYGAMASVSPLAPGTPPPTGKYILKFHFMLRSLDISI